MVKGETYNLQLFESEAFRHFINVFTNKQSGITQGCELNINAQEISVSKGYFFIQGGLLRETTGTSLEIPSETGFYTLVYEIDLSKTNTKDNFNQGEYRIIRGVSDFSNLTQQDLDNDGTIYQLPFCQFIIDEQGLSTFLDVRPIIDYGVYQEKGKIIYENENGTASTINITEDFFAYKEAKIEYRIDFDTQDTSFGSKTIPLVKSGQKSNLNDNYVGSVYYYTYGTQLTITNNKIEFYGNRVLTQGAGGSFAISDASAIKITKITLYKDF